MSLGFVAVVAAVSLAKVAAAIGVGNSFVAPSRLLDPGSFGGAVAAPDYGVSAIAAACLGAVAHVCWWRSRHELGRAAVVLGCAIAALVAYRLHPDLSVLSFEHPLAFALGVLAAAPRARPASSYARGRAVAPSM